MANDRNLFASATPPDHWRPTDAAGSAPAQTRHADTTRGIKVYPSGPVRAMDNFAHGRDFSAVPK
jgi:hypothetical protein